MMDPWAPAQERFGAAGVPKFYTSHLVPLLQEACHGPFLGRSVCACGQSPQEGGCSLRFSPKPPRGGRPLVWGLFCFPWGSAQNGARLGCSCAGPREEEIKDNHVGPAFISGFKEVQTNSVPVPGGSSSLLEAPACSLPPSCSFLESQQSLSPRGTPQGPRLAVTKEERGRSAELREEGGGGLGASHRCLFPLWARLGSKGSHTLRHLISLEPSDREPRCPP